VGVVNLGDDEVPETRHYYLGTSAPPNTSPFIVGIERNVTLMRMKTTKDS
jgi:hypothetical protein